MILEQTIQHLTTLNLIGMKQALQQQIDQPKTFNLSFEERWKCKIVAVIMRRWSLLQGFFPAN